jgi:hypothetical protein
MLEMIGIIGDAVIRIHDETVPSLI